MKPLIMQCSPASLLAPNVLLSTLFSNTLSLCYFLSVTDQVSHPYNSRDTNNRFFSCTTFNISDATEKCYTYVAFARKNRYKLLLLHVLRVLLQEGPRGANGVRDCFH